MPGIETSVAAAEAATIGGKDASMEISGMASETAEIEGEKTYNISYVVHGALIECLSEVEVDGKIQYVRNGTRAGRLLLPISHGVYLRKKAQLNKKDCVPNYNVMSCGICSICVAEYKEEKKQEKDERGFFEKVKDTIKSVAELFFPSKDTQKRDEIMDEAVEAAKCVPIVNVEEGWLDTKEDVFIEDEEALLNISYLVCLKGGIIRIVDDGQMLDDATSGG